MNQRTLVIIPCGQSKVWDKRPDSGPIRASDAYTGSPFKVNRLYAEAFGTTRLILSAKYGFTPFDFEIPGPYNVTFKRRKTEPVSVDHLKEQISSQGLFQFDRIVGLGGKEYRSVMTEAFQAFDRTVEFPFAGLPIGKCMQAIKLALREMQFLPGHSGAPNPPSIRRDPPLLHEARNTDALCESLHELLRTQRHFGFPFDAGAIPKNGIYVLFESGEEAHGGERIVRIGTHTGQNQLRSRLKQHFVQENKDRSIFRKNIGRALLGRNGDSFLADWNLDLTTSAAKELHRGRIDLAWQQEIERQVTEYMQSRFRFVVFPVEGSAERLDLESLIISTVSLCRQCRPSTSWLGSSSPVQKIRAGGLWQVNELNSKPFESASFSEFRRRYFGD